MLSLFVVLFLLQCFLIDGTKLKLKSTANPTAGIPNVLVDANVTFPSVSWAWQRAPPKSFLNEAQKKNAGSTMLNVIETIHWISFPVGFGLAFYYFVNSQVIAKGLDGDFSRVFWIILGLLCQVFGGGISGNMMHTYEGWQVAPFHNPINLSDPAKPGEVTVLRIQNGNNAWLRSVAYQFLFYFQSLGLSLFTLAVYGYQPWTIALVVGTGLIGLLGPKEPRLNLQLNNQPILPLSVSLTTVFAINLVANLFANEKLFYEALIPAWPPTVLPFLKFIPAAFAARILAVLSPLMIGAGGAIEGAFAESTFFQWQHLFAFVVLVLGLSIDFPIVYHLIKFLAEK
eukprot:gene13417-17991_t